MATEGTFSAKPFISLDGIDDSGLRAEVKVVIGFGDVASITDSTSGKTKKIEFSVSNTKFLPSGWSRDSGILNKIDQAKKNNEPIHFRLETRRKEGVDRATPMADISGLATAKDTIVKSLAAVKLGDDEAWTVSGDAVTRPDEDPSTGGLHSAYDNPPVSASAGDKLTPTYAGNTNSYEPAPYVARLRDGKINPGSVALHAPLGFFSYLLEYERDEGVQIEKERRKEMAHTLMLIANKLQLDIYSKKLGAELINGVDLTAGSHTRARFLVFEAIRSFAPITESVIGDDESYKKWQKAIYNTAFAMWEWSIDEAEAYIP